MYHEINYPINKKSKNLLDLWVKKSIEKNKNISSAEGGKKKNMVKKDKNQSITNSMISQEEPQTEKNDIFGYRLTKEEKLSTYRRHKNKVKQLSDSKLKDSILSKMEDPKELVDIENGTFENSIMDSSIHSDKIEIDQVLLFF